MMLNVAVNVMIVGSIITVSSVMDPDKPKCEHVWHKKKRRVRPDNEQFDQLRDFYLVVKICDLCKDEVTINYVGVPHGQ